MATRPGPTASEAVARNFDGMPDEYVAKATYGNITALYGLDEG